MLLSDIPLIASELFDFLDNPIWRMWPFNAGYGDHIVPAIARMIFVAMIFGVIIFFLRFLYGPKGIWRDPELDREADEIRAQEKAILDEQLKNGEITEFEYQIKLKGIES